MRHSRHLTGVDCRQTPIRGVDRPTIWNQQTGRHLLDRDSERSLISLTVSSVT